MLIVVSIATSLRPFLSYFLPITTQNIMIYDYKKYQINQQLIIPSTLHSANHLKTNFECNRKNIIMIQYVYNKPLEYTPLNITWIMLQFLNINFLVFLAFMNACFQTLVSTTPIAVLSVALCLLVCDTLFKLYNNRTLINRHNILDLIVIACLTISFVLYGNNKKIVYLQIITLVKLKDMFLVNHMAYNLVKQRPLVFKMYVVVKITYWIILISHIMGCLFYALDFYLIKNQYFGTINQYPQLYYQGSLHAYSSIYSLSQQWRYVYAIYYSFSLVSTVAFGDIIGKNYFENVLVGCFIIIATIGISLIIEQMYIVFRREKQNYYLLISKIKYVSEFLRTQPNIKNQFRYQLMNYTINAQWKQINETPKLKFLSQKLKKNLHMESVLCKTQPQYESPLFIRIYMLPFLKAKYYPANYNLIDNNYLENHLHGVIIVSGKVQVGYTYESLGAIERETTETSCLSYGFDELIIGTNSLSPYLTVKTKQQSHVFTIQDDEFLLKMKEFKGYYNDYFAKPIEFYQISKDKAMFNQQKFCHYCKKKTHNLINCPKCHYVVDMQKKQLYQKHMCQPRQEFLKRKNRKSQKNTSMKSIANYRVQQGKLNPLSIPFNIIARAFNSSKLYRNLYDRALQGYNQDDSCYSSNKSKLRRYCCNYYRWKIYGSLGVI